MGGPGNEVGIQEQRTYCRSIEFAGYWGKCTSSTRWNIPGTRWKTLLNRFVLYRCSQAATGLDLEANRPESESWVS